MRHLAAFAFAVLALPVAATAALTAEVELSDGTKLADTPYFIVTYIEAAPDATDAVAELLESHAAASRDDDGNLQFEILQREDRNNHFAILEAWADPASRDAHASDDETVKSARTSSHFSTAPMTSARMSRLTLSIRRR